MFPPINDDTEKDYISEFNSFEYWRNSIPEINDIDDINDLISTQNKEIKTKKIDLTRRQTIK